MQSRTDTPTYRWLVHPRTGTILFPAPLTLPSSTGQIGALDELSQLHSVENDKLKFEIKKLKDRVVEKDEEIKHTKEKHTKTIHIWEDKSNQLKKVLITAICKSSPTAVLFESVN